VKQKAIHAIVEGRVQGVYFRDFTRQEAQKLGLCGWVRNRNDGTVEAMIAGKAELVDQMAAWLHTGSPMSLVSKVTLEDVNELPVFSGFTIHY
jgi:acylphosphatase